MSQSERFTKYKQCPGYLRAKAVADSWNISDVTVYGCKQVICSDCNATTITKYNDGGILLTLHNGYAGCKLEETQNANRA